MNCDLQGFLDYFHGKNANGIIITDKGKALSDREAKTYALWGLKNGYTELCQMPEFEDVEQKVMDKIKKGIEM